jgi:acyl-CoA reductase-like NAD-dependent aldehyde dehydrogenase
LQQALSEKLTQSFEFLHQDKKLTTQTLLEENEKALARMQKKIEIATQERDQILARWDQRIEQRKAALIKLEAEIAALKKQVG